MLHDDTAPPGQGGHADGDSPVTSWGRLKWRRMDWLKWESVRPRQRSCQARPTGQSVGLRRSSVGAGFSGLQSCGSTMCPHCGSKIAAVRRQDIGTAVRLWRERGGTVLFGTFTLRHHRGQSLDRLASAVADCWEFATKGRQWSRDKRDHGIAGHLRVWETKHGANGWHQHVHFLLFADGATDAEQLLASMFARWSRRAVALGLGVPLRKGQDLHVVTGDAESVAERMGDYFAKGATDAGRAPADSMGWEIAGGSGKTAGGGATPLQLLDLAMAGDPGAASLWHEYELAMHGRRTIAWSRGLRDLLGIGAELSDEAIAEDEAGDVDDTLVSFRPRVWARLVRERGRGPLLEYAGSVLHSAEDVAAWCAARGWPAVLGRLDDVGGAEPPTDVRAA